VRNVAAQVGQAVLGDRAVGSDSAQMWVNVDPAADYDKTLAMVQRVVDGYPGLSHEMLTYSKDKLRQVLGRTGDEITVRIFGSDLGVLDEKAVEVKRILSAIDGVTGARVASRPAEPTMEVEVDLDKAREFGIKPGDVRRAAATLLSGIRVGSIFEDQKVFDVQVWSTPETRHSVTSVEDLLIDTPGGEPVRLGDVADLRVRPTVPVIRREGVSRFVDVSAQFSGRDLGKVTGNLQDRLERVDFPLEYHAELLGDYSHQQGAQRRLLGFAVAAAIGIFLLLQAAFGSWRLAVMAFLMLPVAMAGGALAAWIDGGPMTLATVAGLLAVLAVAVRNDVMVIGRFRKLRAEAGVPFGPDLLVRGTREGLAPTVMTVLTTAIVLLPALVFGDIAGEEIVRPMAVVMLGGLVTSTLVSLFLLPALYMRFGPREQASPLQLGTTLDLRERPPTAAADVGAQLTRRGR
jgi:Cu/Ag efflux pump CusA